MKLDYTGAINEYGDNMVRLYDFGKSEATLFRNIVKQSLLNDQTDLDLSTIEFIELRNCNLILRLAEVDEGIRTLDNIHFFCDLTTEGYEKMMATLEPFTKRETKGYQYLYDVDSLTDFLFSPGGS